MASKRKLPSTGAGGNKENTQGKVVARRASRSSKEDEDDVFLGHGKRNEKKTAVAPAREPKKRKVALQDISREPSPSPSISAVGASRGNGKGIKIVNASKGRVVAGKDVSPVPSPPASPNQRESLVADYMSSEEYSKLRDDLEFLKDAFLKSQQSPDDQQDAPGFEKGKALTSLFACVFIFNISTVALKDFSILDINFQRSLAIACIRAELKLGNTKLVPGGVRNNSDQLVWCTTAFSVKLHNLSYTSFDSLLNPVVKQALKSVLKTEGRKREDKKEVYNLMIEKGKARVKRWRLSKRLRDVYAIVHAKLNTSADVRTKNEVV